MARCQGIVVIALDSPTEPLDATDALFATDNYKAGVAIGQYAKATFGDKPAKIVTLDLLKSIAVGYLRHNGFLAGFGDTSITADTKEQKNSANVVCEGNSDGDQAKGQAAMETCLQKAPDVNIVYAINEPAATGAYTALKAAGKEKGVLIVAVDGGCAGIQASGRWQDRGDLPAVPVEDGGPGCAGHRQGGARRRQAVGLHRHRCQPDRGQASGRGGVEGPRFR